MLVHAEFPPRNGSVQFSSAIGSAERTLEILRDAHPSISQCSAVSLPSQMLLENPVSSLRANFVAMRTPLGSRRVFRGICAGEAATLRQTQFSGAGRAHSGKVGLVSALKLQLGRRREGIPTQTASPPPSSHHRHYHNYNRRRPRRFVSSIVFKFHSLSPQPANQLRSAE